MTFASRWNGVAILPTLTPPEHEFASDASGRWGCGAWYGSAGSWFQFKWPRSARHLHITFQELVAVVLACAIWGDGWQGGKARCYCDNQAAVRVIRTRTCRDPSLMHLLRCLFFLEAHYGFQLQAVHIPGASNILADELSRNKLSSFFRKVPRADHTPSRIHPSLPALLLNLSRDWTSVSWMQHFSDIVTRG